MRVVKFCHVDKFHVAVNVEADFVFLFSFSGALLKLYVMDLNIKLVAKVEVSSFYSLLLGKWVGLLCFLRPFEPADPADPWV